MALKVPEYIRKLVPYVPGKPIEETQREYKIKRVVKLASNENPLGPSPKALAALKVALPSVHRYPDASAWHLKQALSKHLSTPVETIIVGNGSNEVIDFLIRTYCVPGDAIVTSRAAFIAYRICAQIHGVGTLESPLLEDMGFDLRALAKLVKEYDRARLVFIPNPNNPTGAYLREDELRSFLNTVSRIRGGSVLVALDYAYWEYATAKDLPDPMRLLADYPNVIILRTFSKVHGLAGLRVGYGVARPEIIQSLEKVRQPFNMNLLGLAAAAGALSDHAFVEKSKRLNRVGMRFWDENLRALGIPYWPSQGNFLLIDVSSGLGKRGGDVYHACLKRGVILRPVANYGMQGALRITIGKPDENRIALAALAAELPPRRIGRSKSKGNRNGRG